MSPVNFCNNPITKKVAPEITNAVKQTTGEMKPFPELYEKASKCKSAEVKKTYILPFAPNQNPTVTDINKNLAVTAAVKEYPPVPFN